MEADDDAEVERQDAQQQQRQADQRIGEDHNQIKHLAKSVSGTRSCDGPAGCLAAALGEWGRRIGEGRVWDADGAQPSASNEVTELRLCQANNIASCRRERRPLRRLASVRMLSALLTPGSDRRRVSWSKPWLGVRHADSTGLPSSRRRAWHRRRISKSKIDPGLSPIAKCNFAGPPVDASMRPEALLLMEF